MENTSRIPVKPVAASRIWVATYFFSVTLFQEIEDVCGRGLMAARAVAGFLSEEGTFETCAPEFHRSKLFNRSLFEKEREKNCSFMMETGVENLC